MRIANLIENFKPPSKEIFGGGFFVSNSNLKFIIKKLDKKNFWDYHCGDLRNF